MHREREAHLATLVKVEWNRVYYTSSKEGVFSFFRVSKVSMRANCVSLLTGSCTVMLARPRRSDEVAEVHNVRWTLVLDGPKRSVEVASAKRGGCTKRKTDRRMQQ